MITVAETKEYRNRAVKLLPEVERESLIHYLAEHPQAGVIMRGTGGVRKLRWGTEGRGKSGGVRIIYFYYNDEMPLYLLTVFGKNEKANITPAEGNMLKQLVGQLVKANGR